MSIEFSIEEHWPELFEQLDASQIRAVSRVLESSGQDERSINREYVADLVDLILGRVSDAEYRERSIVRTRTLAELNIKLAQRAPAPTGRVKAGYYSTPDEMSRIRAAFIASRQAGKSWRSLSDFQREAILEKVAQLESELNSGRPFEGVPAHVLSPGRPLD